MKDDKPLVTVVIPTYNRPEFVSRAIQSVLDQTYPNVEVIVIDDASEKDINSVIDAFPTVTFLINETNRGGGYSRNRGIEAANGTYVNFLDDDDILYPQKIEKQVALFESSNVSNLGMVTCGALDQRSGKSYKRLNHLRGNIYNKMLWKFAISGIETMLYKRAHLLDIGGFDEALQSSQEYDLLIRYSKKYSVDFVDEVLTQEFPSTNQISTNFDKKIQGAKHLFKKYDEAYKEQGFHFWLKMKLKLYLILFRCYVGKYIGEKAYRMLIKQ